MKKKKEVAPAKKPLKQPDGMSPFKALVEKIVLSVNVTQNDIERKLRLSLGYLSRAINSEKNGVSVSKILIKKLEKEYEFILTGEKTFDVDQQELNNQMGSQITLIRAHLDVILTELAFLIDPKNASGKKQDLATTAKEVAEKMMRSM